MDKNYSDDIMRKLESFSTGNPIHERDFDVLRGLGCVLVERYISISTETVRRTVTAHGTYALMFWKRKNRGN